MVEPILLNPNSYRNIESILKKIRHFVNIDPDWKWVFAGCDRPPYCLSLRIVEAKSNDFDFATIFPGLGHIRMIKM